MGSQTAVILWEAMIIIVMASVSVVGLIGENYRSKHNKK